MIAPHRESQPKPVTQLGRALRRYRRRWTIERLSAWLKNTRRLVVRDEYRVQNFLGVVHLGYTLLLFRKYS
jgi:transposase